MAALEIGLRELTHFHECKEKADQLSQEDWITWYFTIPVEARARMRHLLREMLEKEFPFGTYDELYRALRNHNLED